MYLVFLLILVVIVAVFTGRFSETYGDPLDSWEALQKTGCRYPKGGSQDSQDCARRGVYLADTDPRRE